MQLKNDIEKAIEDLKDVTDELLEKIESLQNDIEQKDDLIAELEEDAKTYEHIYYSSDIKGKDIFFELNSCIVINNMKDVLLFNEFVKGLK